MKSNNIYSKTISLLVAIILVYISYKYIYNYFIVKAKEEGFTPKIRQMYRPMIRGVGNKLETFTNNYNMTNLINKLRKWNIY